MKTDQNINKTTDNTDKNKVLTWALVLITILLVGAIVMIFYRGSVIKQRNQEVLRTYERLDSIGNELQKRSIEIEKLGGDIAELTAVRAELEQEKQDLIMARDNTNRQLAQLRDRVEGYRELLLAKDVEIENLQRINEELVYENVELKTERQQLNQTIQEARRTQQKLEDKVSLAGRLKAENIMVNSINPRGREREGEFRARQVDKIRIDFNIGKNDVAPIEGKEILLRIIDENDNVLFDVASGGGTFKLQGKETFYTLKQSILFDNSMQQLSFLYDKGSEYNLGRYSVELYTDGYLMGREYFRIK
ncbi:MAG: chromosome segregation protein SMC [Cyclobacteriaceae bacterium]|nr:chromosome segregation protein SMC [Cyclobacteriaceae bacterium]